MKRLALIPVALVVLLPLAPTSPARSQEEAKASANARVATASQKIKELQQERIATLEKLVEQLTLLSQRGNVDLSEAADARVELLRAELEQVAKGDDRISLYNKAIDALKAFEELADAQFHAARATEAIGVKIKSRRLEVEIQFEQTKIKKANDGE
jgi:hypothetical protein